MSFIWVNFLWFLLAIPAMVGLYLLILARKKRAAVRYANLNMVRAAMGTGSRFRRHVPPVLLLTALTVMLLATARPQMVLTLPSLTSDVMLTLDVSGSMRAADVEPTRIEAAQLAAKKFIEMQPHDVKIGITAFAGTAFLVQSPTLSREDLVATIDRLQLQRGTALGSGILISLKTLFPDADIDLGQGGPRDQVQQQRGQQLGQPGTPGRPEPKPHTAVLPGTYQKSIIIALTDGNTNAGVDPLVAARLAGDYGVKVFTVGFGSQPGGGVAEFGGQRQRSVLNEEALRQVAEITRGAYFHASSADELVEVYKTLNREFFTETKETEVTALFAGIAAALTLLSAALSLLWFNRVF
ncbi:MAG: VWA domain-containing protein [Alphaproteobacteria bacterium]|nr:VWA domain-containing protein [Alphaproteobacteria bacterium]